VQFCLPGGGTWLFQAVRVVEAPEDAGADWQSTWSSLTLRLAPTPGGP
jgi:hypothetical protein